jgi:bacillithiol biosynthesis cysteine-adding enzyme BshC
MPSSFFFSYLERGMRAGPFLSSGFGDSADRRRAVARAAERTLAPALRAALETQDAALPSSVTRRRAIADLARPGSAAVLTGQQVGLFLGPLYTVYKAATAIVLARALEAESGVRTVPVFWIATEDHDFAEVDHCPLAPGVVARVAGEPRAHERCPLAGVRLGADVVTAVESVRAAVAARPEGAAIVELMAAHYRPEKTFAQAFAGVLATLFADEGLIVFDPRTPEVAALAAPTYRRALEDAPALAECLKERARSLDAAGLSTQVHVRDAALLFHHAPGADGDRQRVAAVDDALLGELERAPLNFSSSALLRPIVQDSLFPTAAYVGGPAEVSYFAQSSALYERFGLPVPLVAPRARFRLVDARTRARLDKLGLAPADLEQPRDRLLVELGKRRGKPTADELRPRLQPSLLDALDLGPEMARALRRTRFTVERAITRLVDRYARVSLQRDTDAADALDRARAWLFPDDKPQERVFGFPWFAAAAGARTFVTGILDAVRPFEPDVRDIDL